MKNSRTKLILAGWIVISIMISAGCSKGPSPSSDASIADSLKASFYSDPDLKNDRIDIGVNNGEVTLSGEVSSDAARLQAYKLANETAGVKKVTDQLQVKPSSAQEASGMNPRQGGSRSGAGGRQSASLPPGAVAPHGTESSSDTSAGNRSGDTPPSGPKQSPIRKVTIPAGSTIEVQMIDSVDSAKNQIGDTFQASLASPITIDNDIIVPKDTDVYVKLANAKTSGKFSGRSELQLELDHLKFQGTNYPLASSTYQQVGSSRTKDTAKKTAIGAAIGTAIGAIAGGGKGAAIGAGVGAGSGAASQIFLKGKQVQVPSETKIDFKLEQPVELPVRAR